MWQHNYFEFFFLSVAYDFKSKREQIEKWNWYDSTWLEWQHGRGGNWGLPEGTLAKLPSLNIFKVDIRESGSSIASGDVIKSGWSLFWGFTIATKSELSLDSTACANLKKYYTSVNYLLTANTLLECCADLMVHDKSSCQRKVVLSFVKLHKLSLRCIKLHWGGWVVSWIALNFFSCIALHELH